LLRSGAPASSLDPWDAELRAAGEPLTGARQRYVDRLIPALIEDLHALLPELGDPILKFSSGWNRELDFSSALAQARPLDYQRGHTTRGPHRADWKLTFEQAPQREHLSRGQEKLCAIACMLAQARLYVADHGEWPIVLLDDLPSELDYAHQQAVALRLDSAAQVFLTSTELPTALAHFAAPRRTFHVERGEVSELL